MDSKVIEALKNNEKPFGLMTEEMQAKLRKTLEDYGLGSVLYFDGEHWGVKIDYSFDTQKTYRLASHVLFRKDERGLSK